MSLMIQAARQPSRTPGARVDYRPVNVSMAPRGEGILGAIGGALGGFVTGGIGGAIGGAIGGWKDKPTASPGTGVQPWTPPIQPQGPPPINLPFSGAPGMGVGIPGGPRVGYGEYPTVPTTQAGAPKGYHLNKTSYFLKSGEFVPKGSRWVRNRRRNPLNPRALSRSMSRIKSAKKAASALGQITIRKKSCR